MVANILPTDTPLTPGWGQQVKPYLFLKVVMLLIKLKGNENRAPWKQICCHNTHSRPLGGLKMSFFFFCENGRVAYHENKTHLGKSTTTNLFHTLFGYYLLIANIYRLLTCISKYFEYRTTLINSTRIEY